MSRSLTDTLAHLREGITSNSFRSRAEISHGVVKRLLHDLNWPVFDIQIVAPKFRIGPTFVEYALCHPRREPAVLLDVVDPGTVEEHGDGRILKYCAHQGIPMVVLTDGRSWSFYCPAAQAGLGDLCFARMDLAGDIVPRCAELLLAYLAFDDVRSGSARKRAESAQKAAQDQERAISRFSSVWYKLLEGPEPLLVDLFSEEVENATGVRADRSLLTAFIRGRARKEESSPGTGSLPSLANRAGSEPSSADSEHSFSVTLHGETEKLASGAAVLSAVFRKLSALDSAFCRRYAAKYRGRKRQYVARSKDALYPGQKIPRNYCAKLPNGWWVATHCSNTDKMRRIKQACLVAGVEFGSELVVRMHIGSRKGGARPQASKDGNPKTIRVRIGDRDA